MGNVRRREDKIRIWRGRIGEGKYENEICIGRGKSGGTEAGGGGKEEVKRS